MSLWDWLQKKDPTDPDPPPFWPKPESYYQRVVYIKPVLSVMVEAYKTVYGQVIGRIHFLVPEAESTRWPEQPVCSQVLQFFQCIGKSYPEVVEQLEAPLLQGFSEVFSEIIRPRAESKGALERILGEDLV